MLKSRNVKLTHCFKIVVYFSADYNNKNNNHNNKKMELETIPNNVMCRLCLGTSPEMIKLFSSDHNYVSLVTDFTGVEIIESPDMPHLLCNSCIIKLNMLIEFRAACIRTHELLQEQEKLEILIIAEEEEEPEIIFVTNTMIGPEETTIQRTFSSQNLPEIKSKEVSPKRGKISKLDNNVVTPLPIEENKRQTIGKENKTKKTRAKVKKTKTGVTQILVACHLCGKQYPKSQLKYHLNTHNNVRPFICEINKCAKTFPSPYQLKSHQKVCHTDIYPYMCEICGRKFKVKTTMEIHKSYHLDPKLPCSLCGKLFKNIRALRKHTMSHTGERPYLCDKCPKSFQNRYTLRIHQRVHTKEKAFVCPVCGKSYGYNCVLKDHISKKHPGRANEL